MWYELLSDGAQPSSACSLVSCAMEITKYLIYELWLSMRNATHVLNRDRYK